MDGVFMNKRSKNYKLEFSDLEKTISYHKQHSAQSNALPYLLLASLYIDTKSHHQGEVI